jgi:hypothetical protein
MAKDFTICGHITISDGEPVAGLTVRAFDKDLPSLGARSEQGLGEEAITDAEGCYGIVFSDSEFQRGEARKRGKAQPDLLVRVFDGDALVGESKVYRNAGYEARIDLTVALPHLSEYEALVHEIRPVLQGVAIADLTDEDVEFLREEIGNHERHLRFLSRLAHWASHKPAASIDLLEELRRAAQFARRSNVAPEACYAWVRLMNPPDIDRLVAISAHDLRDSLEKAVAGNLIPASVEEQIDSVIRGLKRHEYVRYSASGQLVDETSNGPISRPGFKVQVFDINGIEDTTPPIDLGTWSVDAQGRFAFDYMGPPQSPVPARSIAQVRFELKVNEPDGRLLAETEVAFAPGQSDVFKVPVSVPVAVPPSPSIADLAAAKAIDLQSELASFLGDRKIRTLADVTRSGGLSALSGLPVAGDDPAVLALEAHADLVRISSDLSVNAGIIEKGYSRVSDIADSSLTSFVSKTRESLGDFAAARMHRAASVQTALLDNLATGLLARGRRADASDGLSAGSIVPASCVCDDCDAAVSPAAYLVDLLAYVVKHVLNNGQAVTLQFLETAFHQPFGALPTDCDAVNQRVRQVRICVEVLRAFLGTITLSPAASRALDEAERKYRLAAYLALLIRSGTSYAEIRFARTATDDQRRAIADKLGIRLSTPRLPGGDELDRLFLDENAPAGDPSALTEQALERLFGLADTTRDPLSAGAKLGDDIRSPAVTRWRLAGAQWGRNTDSSGYVYLSEERPNPVVFVVTVYQDEQRRRLVARSDQLRSLGPLELIPQNETDLAGVLEVAAAVPSTRISISVVPELLSWRLRQLRVVWGLQDRPEDAYSDDASPALPSVDPDLLGPDDFRVPFAKANPAAATRAYDLWLARRAFVDKTLAQLAQNRLSQGLAFILQQVLGTSGPMPNLDALLQAVTGGSNDDVEAATAVIHGLSLQVDEFLALMVVRAKDQSAQGDTRNQAVSDAEWSDLYSILTQCIKRSQFPQWRNEEAGANVELDPREFWISIAEPAESDWPPLLTPGVPLIDPDIQTAKDLPEYAAGAQARDAWNQRRNDLIQIRASLKSARESNAAAGFESMMRLAIGFPSPGDPLQHDLDVLRTELASTNPILVAAATDAITNDLCLSLDAFARLMIVRDADRQSDPAKKPSAADYSLVYGMLTSARKRKHEYAVWLADDVARFGPEAAPLGEEVAYWKARKAGLPRWRASAEARQLWAHALLARSGQAVIDPDLMTEDDLRDPFPSRPPFPLHPAFDMLQVRRKLVEDFYAGIVNAARSSSTFDSALETTVGITVQDFVALDAARQHGVDIQARLDQLGLSNRAFGFLISIRDLLTQSTPQPILDAEWQQVASILTQVEKARQFGVWRREEAATALTIDPDFFVSISNPAFSDPSALDSWRAPWNSRRTWEETLRSRIDQENDVAAAMRDTSGEVEGVVLPALRDALVNAAGPTGIGQDVRAAWLEQRLLVAMDDDGCAVTTRVEQALETLQGLVAGLNTGQFKNGLELSDLSAVSWGTGRIDLFASSSDNALWHRWTDGAGWHPWESLGGYLQFGPAAVSRGVGQIDVFACGRHNQLIWTSLVNGAWSDWIPLGGVITASPCAVSSSPGRIDIFVRGSDGALYSHAIQGNVSLGWQLALGAPAPGYFNSAPAAASSGSPPLTFTDIFVWGADNALYKHSLVNNGSLGWGPSLQGILNAHPAAVSSGPDRVDVFVRAIDDAIYEYSFQDQLPLGWQPGLGGFVASPPAVTSQLQGQTNVFVRGGNGALYQKQFSGSWGEWELIDSFALTLVDISNFDEEWKWLGSYATWRAAMLVFLYPENICAPSLRRRYTPGFGDFIGKIRASNGLTEVQACELAREYATSYEDIAKLQIEASCEAVANTYAGTPCVSIPLEPTRLVFLFGRGGITGNSYWSTLDTNDSSDFAQSFWNAIPGIDAGSQIIGAVVYKPYESESRIFLFFRNASASLRFLTFDLQTLSWSDPKDLDLPPGNAAEIKVVPSLYLGFLEPPALMLWAPAIKTYYWRPLSRDGASWEDGDWSKFVLDLSAQQQWSPVSDLFAANEEGPYVRENTTRRIMVVAGGQQRSGTQSDPDDELLGLVEFLSLGHPYSFLRGSNGNISLKDLEFASGPGPIGFLLTGLNSVAPHTGTGLNTYKVFFAYERKYASNPLSFELDGVYAWYINAADPSGQALRPLLAPRELNFVDGQFSIPSHLDEATVAIRRFNLWLVYLLGGESGTHRTYPSEAYYFVPMALAQALQASGDYEAALGWFRTVYDYTAPVDQRKVYYGLILEESLPDSYDRSQDWLLDPLDPHAIAATRRDTYTRYTIQAIVRCLLDYADAEFTRDTSESNARARSLYRTASELLSAPELAPDGEDCRSIIERIGPIDTSPNEAKAALADIKRRLGVIQDRATLSSSAFALQAIVSSDDQWSDRIDRARRLAAEAVGRASTIRSIASLLTDKTETRKKAFSRLLGSPERTAALRDVAARECSRFTSDVAAALSLSAADLEQRKVSLPWLESLDPMARNTKARVPTDEAHTITETLVTTGHAAALSAGQIVTVPRPGVGAPVPKIPAFLRVPQSPFLVPTFSFCVPPNPIIDSLRTHAALNLYKLSSCRNIAGLVRVLEPYAAPTDSVSNLPTVSAGGQLALPGTVTVTPTQYRYAVLIERAKQLAQLAAQFEASMLSALERQDAEAYTLLKARQDVKLAEAGVQLQTLRQKQANDGVTLAQLQQARAQLQVQHFEDLLNKGESQLEKDAITYLGVAADNLADSSTFSYASVVASGATAVASAAEGSVTGVISGASGVLSGLGPASSEVAAKYSTRASILATMASYERRTEEWDFSRSLAQQDVAIGGQQVTIASDQVSIADQEKVVADIQASNAKDTVAFLNNKFTNVDLYEWMGGILQNVYSFFLKQATATAKIAENQLAFERQEPPPGFIQADYWNATSDLTPAIPNAGPDRRGLTGSARLLQDIFKLDDYAFSTNKRKLQIIKTVSLARLAPIEFQQFRETGVLRFVTPMQLFDRDFLGHYLRLISRVRTSVVALIPPNDGIHAMLSSTGLSRVVIGGDTFQTSSIRRDPESVALSAPINASGVFELGAANSDLLLPFEGCGVDGAWEFLLPKASNLFDFSSISDVLLTIEYTALNSFDFQRQLQQALDPSISAEMPYGFRNQFPDQWYDLHNPDQSPTPMSVQFQTLAADFPPNLIDLKIQQVALYFSRADGQTFEVSVASLRFKQKGAAGSVGGAATTVDGLISTRRGNAGSWASMIDEEPFGNWTLEFEDTSEMRARFTDDDIQDILFVVTYEGLTSPVISS